MKGREGAVDNLPVMLASTRSILSLSLPIYDFDVPVSTFSVCFCLSPALSRQESITDLGVAVPATEAALHFQPGWYDALGRGAKNDYCRFGQ